MTSPWRLRKAPGRYKHLCSAFVLSVLAACGGGGAKRGGIGRATAAFASRGKTE